MKTIATIPSLWARLLESPSAATQRKDRWQLLRAGRWPSAGWEDLVGHWREEDRSVSNDGRATKLRLKSLLHGDACETVAMLPRPTRGTVCISTQIGCAVGCTFCATGKMGLRRQLSATEILEQVVVAKRLAHEWSAHRAARIHLRNVVFMGMGEPLHNEQPVHEALSFLISDKGFGFSPRHITLSTVGVPDKMVAAARKFPRLRIALSLHAADQELRRRLVPRATHDLPSLREAIAQINAIDPAGPVWIEYTLLAGVNDSEAHARQLADFCHGLRVEINVIPCNDIAHANVPSGERIANHGYHPPEAVAQRAFVRVLREAGYFTTLRNTLGQSIQAACGQLIWNSSG